jgi:hypothetical protein
MRLTQEEDQDVLGRIITSSGECRYRIREGDHVGRKFKLSARRIDTIPACCPRLTYRGTITRTCNKARVAWTNSCEDEGSTTFARKR